MNVLTPEEIDAYHRMTATIDPASAARDRAWYLARTSAELRVAAARAWDCNDGHGYKMACSYLATKGGAV